MNCLLGCHEYQQVKITLPQRRRCQVAAFVRTPSFEEEREILDCLPFNVNGAIGCLSPFRLLSQGLDPRLQSLRRLSGCDDTQILRPLFWQAVPGPKIMRPQSEGGLISNS
jgi:hypothetical protein